MKGLFHSTVGACLLAGVVLVSSGFAVVWRVVKASTTSTTTTTTVAPTTTSAPKVAVVAPRVVSASSATGNAVITIADMSPDTGVYAVQWVLSDQDFNSYQMYRTTTKTMTVPFLSCTRTYTLRVFVMQENWQMTDGFVNQNVTPHSATFDLTMPACTATAAVATTTTTTTTTTVPPTTTTTTTTTTVPPTTTTTTSTTTSTTVAPTTTVALTCATGGTCAVGDTGPGGGIVFYVASANFTSTGSDCGTACKYLEAAPADQSAGIVWATTAAFCYNDGGTTDNNSCQTNSIYSGDTTAQAASRTAATAIGMGMANTNQVHARLTTAGGASTSTYAAGIAFAFTNNGKTDWHLPSKDELNQLYNERVTVGGFSDVAYWSSSELDNFPGEARSQLFGPRNGQGSQDWTNKSTTTPSPYVVYVRPVRAFG